MGAKPLGVSSPLRVRRVLKEVGPLPLSPGREVGWLVLVTGRVFGFHDLLRVKWEHKQVDLIDDWISDITALKLPIEIDPVSSLIATAALLVALASLRQSKRSVDLSERLVNERGKFRGLEIVLPELRPMFVNGRRFGSQEDMPQRDMSTGALQVVAYSGDNELTVEDVKLVLTYTKGLWKPSVFMVTMGLSGNGVLGLNIKGPPLPHTMRAHDSATWNLPKIFIETVNQSVIVPDFPGVLLMDPGRGVQLEAEVRSTAYRSMAASGLMWGWERLIQRGKKSRFARHYPYDSLDDLMKDTNAPEELKHLLRLWERNQASETEPLAQKPRGPAAPVNNRKRGRTSRSRR